MQSHLVLNNKRVVITELCGFNFSLFFCFAVDILKLNQLVASYAECLEI